MELGIDVFHMPENIYFEKETLTETYGKLIAEPLESGYGITIGNLLRRVLLSSLGGFAITSIKIDGVFHEFSTIEGVKEDVIEIILNLKKVKFKMHVDREVIAYIDIKDKNTVTAGDINGGSDIEILNPDEHIASLDKVGFKVELRLNKGRGYVVAEESDKKDLPIGTIVIDAVYTPIKKVVFSVKKTRVGKSTDYDKLILDLWTDGSISPEDAVIETTKIIIEHMKYFLLNEKEVAETFSKEEAVLEAGITTDDSEEEKDSESGEKFNKSLLKLVDDIEFSVRSQNCLKNANIKYMYELVQKTEYEILKTKNFGRTSLNEIKETLHSMGLDFNMKIDMDEIQRELAAQEQN